jgi:signal transduction histidine kinase
MLTREELYRRFVADEIASSLRHRVVNKLAGIGALSFHLKRQLGELPEAAAAVFPLMDAELGQATAALGLRLVDPSPGDPPPLPLVAAVQRVLRDSARAGLELNGPSPSPLRVAVSAAELDLAIFCLVENACQAATAHVRVRVIARPDAEGGPLAVVEINDDGPGLEGEARQRAREPLFSTRGRLGLGLNIASRVADRGRGRLELDGREGAGLHVRLVFPEAR